MAAHSGRICRLVADRSRRRWRYRRSCVPRAVVASELDEVLGAQLLLDLGLEECFCPGVRRPPPYSASAQALDLPCDVASEISPGFQSGWHLSYSPRTALLMR